MTLLLKRPRKLANVVMSRESVNTDILKASTFNHVAHVFIHSMSSMWQILL